MTCFIFQHILNPLEEFDHYSLIQSSKNILRQKGQDFYIFQRGRVRRGLTLPSSKSGPETCCFGFLSIATHSLHRQRASSAAQSSTLQSRGRICKHYVENLTHSEFLNESSVSIMESWSLILSGENRFLRQHEAI